MTTHGDRFIHHPPHNTIDSALAECGVAHARALMGLGFALEPEPAVVVALEQEAAEQAKEEEEVIARLARLATRDDGEEGEEEGESK